MAEPSLSSLSTELANPDTGLIDTLSSLDLVTLINSQDAWAIRCIQPVLPQIALAIDQIVPRLRNGGRVLYFGAGTSGRLGILDASECMPTFNCDQFVGIMAGGDEAIRKAKEGSEDSEQAGEADLKGNNIDPHRDVAVGLAASGRTPYVLGGLRYAHSIGCLTVGVACTYPSAMSQAEFIDIMISPIPGPEVITGSTRMKAGTTTKLASSEHVINGKYDPLGENVRQFVQMVDLRVSNAKLQARGRNIIRIVNKGRVYIPSLVLDQDPSDDILDSLISQCGGSVKLAIIIGRTGWSVERGRQELETYGGVLASVLDALQKPSTSATQALNLCVDGGGTHTRVILSTITGDVVGRGSAGPSNVAAMGIDASLASLRSALTAALNSLPTPVSISNARFGRAWVGHAGIDPISRPETYEAYGKKVEEFLGLQLDGNLKVTSDAQLLTASLLKSPQRCGVVLVAGTGSVSMLFLPKDGSDELELVSRAGGYGYLLGDEGSAYAIGRQAIRHALSNPSDDLTKELLKHFGVASTANLIPLVYREVDSSKSLIASASRVVVSVFENGDRTARTIVEDAVKHLAELVVQVIPENMVGRELAVCVTGGLTSSEKFKEVFGIEMKKKGRAFVIHWIDDPALLALQSLSG